MVLPKHSPSAPNRREAHIHPPAKGSVSDTCGSLEGASTHKPDSDDDGDDADGAVPVIVMKRLGFDQAP